MNEIMDISCDYCELNKYVETIIKDKVLIKTIKKYLSYIQRFNDYEIPQYDDYYVFKRYLRSIADKNLNCFKWSSMVRDLDDRRFAKKDVLNLYAFMYKSSLITDEYSGFLQKNFKILTDIQGSHLSEFIFSGSNPKNILIIYDNELHVISRFYLDNDNVLIREIISDFLRTMSSKELGGTRTKRFVKDICGYLGCIQINDIKELNASIFIYLYEKVEQDSIFDKDKTHRKTTLLVRFFRYVYERFTTSGFVEHFFLGTSGICKEYLYRTDFSHMYSRGYRSVHYDYHNYPEEDKWIVSKKIDANNCTGLEDGKTISLDFSMIKNNKLKFYAKKTFCCENASLYSKEKSIKSLLQFISHYERNRYDKRRKLDFEDSEKFDFGPDDIISFMESIQSSSRSTVNKFKSNIKLFLNYVHEDEDLTINPIIYEYLKTKKDKEEKGNPMSHGDYTSLLRSYENGYESNDVFKRLEWIIFILMSTTYLRFGEVLNLKRDSIIDTIEKVERFSNKELFMLRKKSSGKRIRKPVAEYTIELIEEAIKITWDLSNECVDKDIACNIFICRSKNIITTIRKDTLYRSFKRKLVECGISKKRYTYNNLRDTYMSNLFNICMKDGMDIDDVHIATGHASLHTTLKHYTKKSRINYLEAFYEVRIGNVDISGIILNDVTEIDAEAGEDIKALLVRDQLGYCGSGTCVTEDEFECLKCNSFRTTISKLPLFEQQIEIVDKKLNKEGNPYRINSLLSTKSLLVMYIDKIVERMDDFGIQK